jgi:hypothetical protein
MLTTCFILDLDPGPDPDPGPDLDLGQGWLKRNYWNSESQTYIFC